MVGLQMKIIFYYFKYSKSSNKKYLSHFKTGLTWLIGDPKITRLGSIPIQSTRIQPTATQRIIPYKELLENNKDVKVFVLYVTATSHVPALRARVATGTDNSFYRSICNAVLLSPEHARGCVSRIKRRELWSTLNEIAGRYTLQKQI